SWTRSTVVVPSLSTGDGQYSYGELVIDSSGRHLFPVAGYSVSTGSSSSQLVSWTSASTTSVQLPPLTGRTSMTLQGTSRLYALGGNGVMDVQLSTPLSGSTLRTSLVETFSTTQHAIATDAAGLPRLVVNHGSTLEVVRPAGSPGFWDWLELGPADSGLIDVSVDGADDTRACFVRAGKLMLY
ncbi:MAG: hypothetical protein Q8L14_37335, partial [Myxococcales bacterium]|nr:hypothetical protein [Myxococcales bacterium]